MAGPQRFESADAVRLGPLRDLPAGTCRQVRLGADELTVYHVDGELFATSGHCRHQQAPLADGTVVRRGPAARPAIECPWHRWRYDLATGARRDAPGTPLATHRLAVDDDGWLICLDPP